MAILRGPELRRRRRLLAPVAALLTVGAMVSAAGSDPAPGASPATDPEPISLSMAVRPGEPVIMKMVTEKSKSEYAGKDATGQGIDVALIDSGVTPVDGLDQPGKIINGPDLSNEGGFDNLAGLNIRVLNLSLGVPGVASNQGDPLSAAVERAWDAGIVVVAATGNRGNDVGGIDSPAVSPYVIAVGAHEMYDSSGAQDWIAPWSSGGNSPGHPTSSHRVVRS